ncbi:MAG: AbrB/MazE/SpoVT family DNA-binding domain-containing protein [Promethearchaeota archaeon]|jgi:antitoxin component of MazEF toxin-antitoxin module
MTINQNKVELRKVQKIGSSLSVTIPSQFAEKLGLQKGDLCLQTLLLDDECIIIRKHII